MRHQQQRQRRQHRAYQEIRPPAAQHRMPGAVAHRADDRLHDQSGQRSRQPQQRELALVRSEVFVDRRHVPHLQPPAELDAEKSEGHVPDLPEGEVGSVGHGCETGWGCGPSDTPCAPTPASIRFANRGFSRPAEDFVKPPARGDISRMRGRKAPYPDFSRLFPIPANSLEFRVPAQRQKRTVFRQQRSTGKSRSVRNPR